MQYSREFWTEYLKSNGYTDFSVSKVFSCFKKNGFSINIMWNTNNSDIHEFSMTYKGKNYNWDFWPTAPVNVLESEIEKTKNIIEATTDHKMIPLLIGYIEVKEFVFESIR